MARGTWRGVHRLMQRGTWRGGDAQRGVWPEVCRGMCGQLHREM